jgi:hypothetical protein
MDGDRNRLQKQPKGVSMKSRKSWRTIIVY